MNSRRLVALVWIALAAACGARTGLLAPEIEDASVPDVNKPDVHDAVAEDVHEEDATEEDVVFPDVPIISDCPDAGDTLVYVLGLQRELYSFYPPTLKFKFIGTVSCPTAANPNSMAVTRSGIAFTNFNSGELFEVSTANAACKATTYQANQKGWTTYGMGYAGNPDGGETLYVSGFSNQGLALIDTTLFTLVPIAQYQPVQQFQCELTGTGAGDLYGFCPFATGAWFIHIDPVTAKILDSHQLSTGGQPFAWAFAFWGGDFWLFLNGNVTKYDPVAQTETFMTAAPVQIVGAGRLDVRATMNAVLLAALCSYWSGNGPTVYNGQQGLDDTYANAIDTAGVGGFRMGFRIDGHASWDQALFDQYDALLAKAKAHGLEVLAIVLYESTPPSAGGQAQWNMGYDASGMNAYVQTFVDTAKTLITRYGDRIKHWEIWNEPNAWTNSNYQNDPANAGGTYLLPLVYAKMLAETFVQNESLIASKGLHLVTGSLFAHDIGGGFSPGDSYMQEVYANGVWDWMEANEGRRYAWDAFGYHVYIDQGGATSSAHLAKYLDAIEAAKTTANDVTPLWITEYGWQAPKNMTLAEQASNLDVALTTFESRTDVERTFVFKLDDYDDWGIFSADFSPKPSVATFQKHDQNCTKATPAPDAGTIDDAGPTTDASYPDAGPHPPGQGVGCSCDSSPRKASFVGALSVLLMAFLRRRKRA